MEANLKFGNCVCASWLSPVLLWWWSDKYIFVKSRGCRGMLLYSNGFWELEPLLWHQNRKFNGASPRPLKNTESITVVQQQTKATSLYHVRAESYSTTTFLPPGFARQLSNYWCEFFWRLFQMHKEALKPLGDWPTGSITSQKLINKSVIYETPGFQTWNVERLLKT